MQFDSLQAFIEMGGHGVYVWAAYSVAAIVIIGLSIQPGMKRRAVLKAIKMRKNFEEQR